MTAATKKKEEGVNIPKDEELGKVEGIDLDECGWQDEVAEKKVEQKLTSIPIRKPYEDEFFRVHSSFECNLTVYYDRKGKKWYLVYKDAPEEVKEVSKNVTLVLCTNIHGELFWLLIKRPVFESPDSTWYEDKVEAVALGRKQWIRVTSNQTFNGYKVRAVENDTREPEWPNKDIKELLTLTFKDRSIRDELHPIAQSLKKP